MENPYILTEAKVEEPPESFFGKLKYLGPGFILSASIVGSGELIMTTQLGAKAGFVTLWVVLVSCLVKVAVQLEFGKHAINTGKASLANFGLVGVGGDEIMICPFWLAGKGYAAKAGLCDGFKVWVRWVKGWIRLMYVGAFNVKKRVHYLTHTGVIGIIYLGACNLSGSEEQQNRKRVLKVPFAYNYISVNGVLDEWSDYDGVVFKAKFSDERGDKPRVQVKTAWDERKIYFAFDVKDKHLIADETSDLGAPWRDDAIEVYLSVAPEEVVKGMFSSNEFQFIVNLNGAVVSCRGTKHGMKDRSWNVDIFRAVRINGSLNDSSGNLDEGYTVEMSIPWKILGFNAAPAGELSVNFVITDRRDHLNYYERRAENISSYSYDWCGYVEKSSDPARWNTLVLLRALVSGNVEPVTDEKKTTRNEAVSKAKWDGWPILGLIAATITIGGVNLLYKLHKKRKLSSAATINKEDYATNSEPHVDRNSSNGEVAVEASWALIKLAKEVNQLISDQYANNLTACSVAESLNVSERQMRRALQCVERRNFSKILQEIRLAKSCDLLKSSKSSISEIAQAVGFGEHSHFSRLFKARYMISPSDYRNSSKDSL